MLDSSVGFYFYKVHSPKLLMFTFSGLVATFVMFILRIGAHFMHSWCLGSPCPTSFRYVILGGCLCQLHNGKFSVFYRLPTGVLHYFCLLLWLVGVRLKGVFSVAPLVLLRMWWPSCLLTNPILSRDQWIILVIFFNP